MQESQVLSLLEDGKACNGGADSFTISVNDLSIIRAMLSILKHLEAKGTIGSFSRQDPPNDCCIDVVGYTG